MSNIDTLTGRRPADTYPGLMKLGRVAGEADIGKDTHLDGQMRFLQDGDGNKTPIGLSSTAIWLYDSEMTTPTATRQILQYEEAGGVKKMKWVAMSAIRTIDITESPGKVFWSEGQFDSSFSAKTTDHLAQGNINKYFSNSAARAAISVSGGKLSYDVNTGIITSASYSTSDVLEGTNLYFTQSRFDSAFSDKSTNNLIEGANNLYFTTARARAAISVTGGGAYNSTTGVITIPSAAAAATSISGGLPQQIPFQATTGSTTFSNALKWDNSVKRLVLGDIVSGGISGYGGTSVQSVFTIASGSSVYGSQLNLSAGDATTQRGGDATISAGNSSTGVGGDVIISSGASSVGGGSLIVRTGASTLTEKLRVLPSGAISYGPTGSATGMADQYLASSGPSTSPVWKSLPTRSVESGTSDNLANGLAGQMPYQVSANVTAFSDVYWQSGTLSIKHPSAKIESSNGLIITTSASSSTGNINLYAGKTTGIGGGSVILRTTAAASGGEIRLVTETEEILTVSPNGAIRLAGGFGTVNQVPIVDADGKTKFKSLNSSIVGESGNLYWTQARFNTAFAAKNTDGLSEGTTNQYYSESRFSDSFTGKTTSDLTEGTRLYWTQGRFNTAFTAKTTSDITEGTKLFYTPARFDAAFALKSTTNLPEGTNLYWTQARFDSAIAGKTTDSIQENTNLYHTPARARSSISATGNVLTYNATTGVLGTSIDTSKVPEVTNLYHTTARARSAISATGDVTFNSTTGVISYSRPSGVIGAVPFVSVNGTTNYTTSPLVTVGSFIASDSELTFAQNQVVPQSEALATWKRFSHAGTTQPYSPSELLAWEYVQAQNAFRNTTNSSTAIGLVSNVTYGDYDNEVRVYSTSGDDDTIGVVLAFVVIDGREHTLSAIRTCGGNGRPWQIRYNHNQTGARDFTGTMNAVKWSNGNYGFTQLEAGYTGSPGWSTFGTVGTKIKVTRRGNLITCVTTDIGTEEYLPASTIVIDLDSDTDLRKFIGRTQVGYLALSQQFSYWQQIAFTDYSPIYDVRDGSKWSVDGGGVWSNSKSPADSIYAQVGIGRMVYDQLGKSIYYLAKYGTCLKMAEPANAQAITSSMPVLVGQYEFQLASNATQSYSLATILGTDVDKINVSTVTAELLVYDTDSARATYQYYVPATDSMTVGIKTNGDILVKNASTGSNQFILRIHACRI